MIHYLDMTKTPGFGIMSDPGDTIVFTGVSINAMPLSVKKREGELYEDFARKYGFRFIFDDKKPEIDFYSVPSLDIAATDDKGGFLASVGQPFDLHDPVPLVYISPDRRCYLITENSTEFLSIVSHWRSRLTPFEGVKLYRDKAQAKGEYPIVDFETTEIYRLHMENFPG